MEIIKVYAPTRGISKRNSGLAKFMGVFTMFLVSGLFHELLFFYTTRETPLGAITLSYVLNGIYMASEVVADEKTPFGWRWAVRAAVAFMYVISGWLYFPQINTAANDAPPMKPC